MKTIDKVLRILWMTGNEISVGNHSARKIYANGVAVRFYYHFNNICTIYTDGTFTVDNCGWGTSSTTRAINYYKKTLKEQGYNLKE